MKNLNQGFGDLPRERLLERGKSSLSCTELLMIMIGNGGPTCDVIEIVKNLKDFTQNNIHQLYTMEVKDLCKVKGLGIAKSAKIVAALELSKRIQFPHTKDVLLFNSKMVFDFMKNRFFGLSTEEFWMICLNQQSKVIDVLQLFIGGLTSTIVDVRVVFQKLISNGSTSFIVLHNHPSGNLKPSQADVKITKKIVNASKIFDIKLLDHLIVADNSYFSFADHKVVL